jgi:hypothetical protein
MAKKKKKKKKKKMDYGTIDPGNNQNAVTIIVPDQFIQDYGAQALHGIGRLTYNATSAYNVDDVAIVAASKVTPQLINVTGWQKAGAEK